MNDIDINHDADNSTDDSPQNEDHPYHSLSGSNLTLRRYGTVSSLERLGADENEDGQEENAISSESEDDETECGIDNEAFNHTSLRNWTVKAGSFVFEKMAFFERLGGCRTRTGVSERSQINYYFPIFMNLTYLSGI